MISPYSISYEIIRKLHTINKEQEQKGTQNLRPKHQKGYHQTKDNGCNHPKEVSKSI